MSSHQINETHLGTEATPEEARKLAEILTRLGYASEYNATIGVKTAIYDPEMDLETEIPQDVWDQAMAILCGAPFPTGYLTQDELQEELEAMGYVVHMDYPGEGFTVTTEAAPGITLTKFATQRAQDLVDELERRTTALD